MKLLGPKFLVITGLIAIGVGVIFLSQKTNREEVHNLPATAETENQSAEVETGSAETEGEVPTDLTNEPCRSFEDAKVIIGSAEYSVEIAHTKAQQATGLQGCAQLADDQGMYFLYLEPQRPAFWMKDMLIPLDIVWIKEGQVVGVTANVPPAAEAEIADIPRYEPPEEIDAVLEIAAGQAEAQGIEEGSSVQLIP